MRHAFLLTLLAGSLSAAPPQGASATSAAAPAENTVHWLRENFAAPPAAYSTMPFLVWNGEVAEPEIDRHLQAFHDQGVRGFFIHPRPGLITEYLSPRWFDLIAYTVRRARELGMQAWLYDEDSYPSGFAGGHVNEQMPSSWNEGQGLSPVRQNRLQPDATKHYAAILRRSGGAWADITAQAADWTGKEGDFTLYEIVLAERSPFHAGWSYVDLIHPGVTEKFLDVTMSGYERAIGASFGRTVPGVFSDEPNIEPPGRDALRWTPDLFDQFRQRRGYDLAPLLPSLWEETGDWKKVRHDYFAVLLELFNERWSMPYSDYAEKHHLAWTGHYWEHEWPNPWPGPDNMAMYAWQQQPGIDLLFNQYSEQVHSQFGNARAAREVASVGSQMGRRRVLCETYGGGGWELRFEDMKRLGDWEYAHGINFMNQHLSFSTLVGSRKYDWPQSFGEHDPWWGQYHVLANYFARLSLALAAGETRNDTLILEPTTSAWMYAARPASNPRLDEIGNTFQQFINALESRQIEYDLGSEQILRHFGSVDGARLRIRERAYSRVVLPPGLETLDASTVGLLEKFLSAGGTVLSFVDVPRLVDGAPSDRVTALGVKYAARWKRLGAPDELATAGVAFLPLDRSSGGNLFHLRRKLDSGELLFLVNTSLDAPASAVLTAKGAAVQKLDAFTGKLQPYPWKRVAARATTRPRLAPARIQAAFDIPPAGSLLLLVSTTPATPPKPEPKAAPETVVAPEGPLAVHRLSPNILRLDYLDLTLAGKEEKGIYFYTAADEIFKHYGFDGNPWLGAVQFKTELLDKDHFPPESGFSAAFHFRIAPGVSMNGLQAVVERPWLWKVLVNGVEVNSPEGAAWIDPDFGLYPIAAAARAGDNVLTLVAQPFSVHHELEPVYILGDFGVQAEPAGFSIVPATTLALGDWKSQQMPFYSDRVAYTRHYTLAAAQAALVRMDKWWGSTAEIRVNGQSAGVMVNPPWEADITPFLHDGDNSVDVVVYGSLKNVFGPHLGKITRGFVSPWSHRYPPTPRQQPPGSAYDLDGYGLQTDFAVVTHK